MTRTEKGTGELWCEWWWEATGAAAEETDETEEETGAAAEETEEEEEETGLAIGLAIWVARSFATASG
jgi:hypothetical protein